MKTIERTLILVLGLMLLWLGVRQQRMQSKIQLIETEREAAETEKAQWVQKWEAAQQESQEQTADSSVRVLEAERKANSAAQRLQSVERKLQSVERALEQGALVDGSRSPRPIGSLEGQPVRRNWGPEQVVGAPDTHEAGDLVTAWASKNPDAGEEWLELGYEAMVDVAEIRVRETYNPGAISKVVALDAAGQEIVLWEGVQLQHPAPVEISFAVAGGVQANSIRVYLDTKRVPGWNEIDAVELVGRDGSRQWAKTARASSTYAE